ncbi:MAG: HDOD domain-containing protein, partial [Gammaproteobacteria bacterium]|nr:HDOD domain-containing protein [Gammaproteobacteria bacterium]
LFLKRTDEMATLVERHEREGTSIQDLEYEMFSFHHADVGGALLKKWNVPISIVEPVLMHLDPKFSEDEYISSCLIYLADKVVRAKQGCQTNEQLFASIDDDVLVGVNLDEEQLCELWQSAEEEIKVVSRQFVTH